MGYTLPPGTVVSQVRSRHRDSLVFPSPDTFHPERWFECSQAELASMTQHMMPFGTGTRACEDQHMAQVTPRIVFGIVL
ncbi:hypothetical protein P691DRAFT_803596 [Macrolepiota fuliginosa MF-IS2]|uniref:Cytochrome P450 n=1 Tax=Macrolepiota fuliginosa MF-IS2 TaxID=1400762 RepID=A0A9P6C2T5_9AGAR|nr:hypothetical protein P691DRAFT_803596 [Macrolepiota fuliginosa MF-IS2]